MHGPELAIVGALGLIFGSFVTALSYRIPRGESIAKGRSHCPACGHVLTAADLVPVLSWVTHHGACGHCGAKVSWRYPAIEGVTAGLFIADAVFADTMLHLGLLLAMTVLMVALAVIDLEHKRLPDVLILPLSLLALGWRVAGDRAFLSVAATVAAVFVIGAGRDFVMRRLSGKPGLGMGDTKLFMAAALAVPLGPFLLFTFIAAVLGFGGGLVWRARQPGFGFPFGPAILFSFWLGLVFGDHAFARVLAAFGP